MSDIRDTGTSDTGKQGEGSGSGRKGDYGKQRMWEEMARSSKESLEKTRDTLRSSLDQFKDRYIRIINNKAVALVGVELANTLDISTKEGRDEYDGLVKRYGEDQDFFNNDDQQKYRPDLPFKRYDCVPRYRRAREQLQGDLDRHNASVERHNADLESKPPALKQYKVEKYDYTSTLPPSIAPLPTFAEALQRQLWRPYTNYPRYQEVKRTMEEFNT